MSYLKCQLGNVVPYKDIKDKNRKFYFLGCQLGNVVPNEDEEEKYEIVS